MPLWASKVGLFGAAGAGAESTDTGLAAGGDAGSGAINIIEYVTISSTGNATDFGDLTRSVNATAGTSNGVNSRGIFGGGNGPVDVIDYVTISSAGDATDFGDLLAARANFAACSNGTSERGVWMGGELSDNNPDNVMQYVTISSTGNATDFGDFTVAGERPVGVLNGPRGVAIGRATPSISNVMDYITIATTGNATDFGDMVLARYMSGGASGT